MSNQEQKTESNNNVQENQNTKNEIHPTLSEIIKSNISNQAWAVELMSKGNQVVEEEKKQIEEKKKEDINYFKEMKKKLLNFGVKILFKLN